MTDLESVKACVETILNHNNDPSDDTLLDNLKLLRNSCSKSKHIQEFLASNDSLHAMLEKWLYMQLEADCDFREKVKLLAWQLLANTVVSNENAQSSIWKRHKNLILDNCPKPPLGRHTDIQLMIIYNIFRSNASLVTDREVLKVIIQLWANIISEKYQDNLEFIHFLFEYFIVEGGRRTVNCYMHLTTEDHIAFLDYLGSYIRQGSPNGLIHPFLLQHLSKEFKIKSDCVLRQLTQSNNNDMHSREVYALLRVLACASGSENYEVLFANDHALFLNVTSLLRCLVAAGKETTNIFTPMNKLQEVAPSSTEVSREFETQVSFEMKTLLIRCIANLLYKNPINQGYCLDTELMPALFECTNMDARNPLIKEWSILAIRNACIGCPEIQQVVANLTKVGVSKNDMLEELNIEMGSLRIKPNIE